MTPTACPQCDKCAWSLMDRQYLDLYGNCWSCDKKKWEQGQLALDEFELREQEALNKAKID